MDRLMKKLLSAPNQDRVREEVLRELEILKIPFEVDKLGNIVATKGEANIYPCLNAHMDCIYEEQKKKTKRIKIDNAFNISSPSGIGGDDRIGCFLILNIMKSFNKPIKGIFTINEEVGGIGSSSLEDIYLQDVSYILVLDRRGNSDIITSIFGKLASDKFTNTVKKIGRDFSYFPCDGSFSDTLEWSSRGIDSVNLSVGYHKPHSKEEYVSLEDVLKARRFILALLKKIPCDIFWKHQIQNEKWNFWRNENEEEFLVCEFCGKAFYEEVKIFTQNYILCNGCREYIKKGFLTG